MSFNRSPQPLCTRCYMLDADLLVDLILSRPGISADYASFLWQCLQQRQIQGCITELGYQRLCIIMSQRNSRHAQTLAEVLMRMLTVCRSDANIWLRAHNQPFEYDSAEEIACALHYRMDGLITHRPEHFEGAGVPVLSPRDVLEYYLRRSLQPAPHHAFPLPSRSITHLANWRDGQFDASWLPLMDILEQGQLGTICRDASLQARSFSGETLPVARGKFVEVRHFDRRLEWVALIVQLCPTQRSNLFDLSVICAARDGGDLPAGLQLWVVDQQGNEAMVAQPSRSGRATLQFEGQTGEAFDVVIGLGGDRHVETFLI
ncbi:MAG: PIN domain-containing protein [Cyanobacteriota bacterium]